MERKQISLDGLIKRTTVLSFDDTSVYIDKGGAQRAVPFADVVSLFKTSNALNNRYFWRLEYRVEGATEIEKFRTNATIWNRSFHHFHARLSEVNPAAIKSPCRWWNL